MDSDNEMKEAIQMKREEWAEKLSKKRFIESCVRQCQEECEGILSMMDSMLQIAKNTRPKKDDDLLWESTHELWVRTHAEPRLVREYAPQLVAIWRKYRQKVIDYVPR